MALLARQDINVDRGDVVDGLTPLHVAVDRADPHAMASLLRKRADVNLPDADCEFGAKEKFFLPHIITSNYYK